MITQRISDRRMIGRGIVMALVCGCWLLVGLAVGQDAAPRAAPATAPAKTVPPARKPASEVERHPTVFYLKYAHADSTAETLAKVAEARELDASFVAETRLNAIIVQASPEVLDQVEQLLKVLDAPAVSPADQKDAKQDQEVRVRIYRLKYAQADAIAEVLRILSADNTTVVASETASNSIIVSASAQQQGRVEDLIEELDVPPARDVAGRYECRVFKLVHTEAESVAKVITTLLGPAENIAVDERTNSILAQGTTDTLLTIEAILADLDKAADKDLKKRGPGTTFQVRVVWLANGLSDDDAADPTADLKGVLDPLRLMGVKDLRQVGQVIVNTTPDGQFQVRCSPVLNQRSSDLEISGEFVSRQETPTLRIQLSANQTEEAPQPGSRRGPSARETLVDLETVISAPLGHYVVLGVAPVEQMTSVFIVQIIAGK